MTQLKRTRERKFSEIKRWKIIESKRETWNKKCQEIETYIGGRKCSEVLREWIKHYADLLSEQRPEYTQITPAKVRVEEEEIYINTEEVKTAIQQLRTGKSPGPSRISSELLKNASSSSYSPTRKFSGAPKVVYVKWKVMKKNLESEYATDDYVDKSINKEKMKMIWCKILKIKLDAILFCAKNNIALRGSNEIIEDPNCSISSDLIEFASHYNTALKEHIEKHKKGSVSYFSPTIQSEINKISWGQN
ncbi:hypothetical protein ILUMI_13001 [Ignelater luminosus]|uniref:Uncharacterized protein n=1 Tax=Ignelater luminosus TaxID=2038154 RepID=A0A8K0G919_IGNLU|nr:hypothetical protein ILUMI_13001 [Ignelater luminosus]